MVYHPPHATRTLTGGVHVSIGLKCQVDDTGRVSELEAVVQGGNASFETGLKLGERGVAFKYIPPGHDVGNAAAPAL